MTQVVTAGMVPPGASGVRDYGRLLSQELIRRGRVLQEVWIENPGAGLLSTLRASSTFVRSVRSVPPGALVVWHYSSFAYGWRGVSLPGVLFGLFLRLRRIRVLTVLHELAYPWGRRGVRGRLQSLTQWIALPFVLLGSSAVLVTTERRHYFHRRLPRPFRRPVWTVPVFATVEVAAAADRQASRRDAFTIGLLGYTGDGSRPDLLFEVLSQMRPAAGLHVVCLGSPGLESPEGERVRSVAMEKGVDDLVEFSGVLPPEEFSRRTQACDVILFLNEEGPSSRRTTLAISLAHGMPVICLDGSDRWESLIDADAAVLVPPEPGALAKALRALMESPSERDALGARARALYTAGMGVAQVADVVDRCIEGATVGE